MLLFTPSAALPCRCTVKRMAQPYALPVRKAEPSFSLYNSHACASFSLAGKPERVAVVGAGVGGLATALTLLRTPGTGVQRVSLFDSRETLDTELGAALNMNSGAAVLAKCYGLGPKLWEIGNPLRQVRSCVADGTSEGGDTLFNVDIQRTVLEDRAARELLVSDGKVLTLTIMRDKLQQLLFEELPPGASIIRGQKVTEVLRGDSGKYRLQFEDGSQSKDEYDLIVGADGIRSNVRKYVSPSSPPPVYSGIQLQFAVTPPRASRPAADEDGDSLLRQFFGDGAYGLLYTGGGENAKQDLIALSYTDARISGENSGYERSEIRAIMRDQLQKTGINQGVVMEAFNRAERFIQVGVYFHQPLSKWSDSHGGCVLLGDAAHALPPFLGAGAGQAIQDSRALAVALSDIGDKHASLPEALVSYQKDRALTTNAIMQTSRVIGFLETQGGVGARLRNNLFRLINLAGVPGRVYVKSATPTCDMSTPS